MINTRLGWRSSTLKKGFERTIVGFDLRRNYSLNDLFMTSYDDSVRYEEINEKYQPYLSGLNLFQIDPSHISLLLIPADARIIALDLPSEFVVHLLNNNVSNPEPLPLEKVDESWQFMGFDVVDAITQTSAFHGFDCATSTIEEIVKKNQFYFNSCGLIDDEWAVIRAATFFDDLVKEHAPFSPCGIWLKK